MMDIPFTRPDITEAEIDAVVSVLQSGWLTSGPVVARFEQALVRHTGAQGAVCVSSATAGLELALRLCGVGPGDEVIVPAYTFSATAAAVIHVGAAPVMADCAPGSFLLDPERVRPLLTDRTAAVIPVDVGGVPCDYAAIRRVCRTAPPKRRAGVAQQLNRPAVIADAAHSLGAAVGEKQSGALADVTVFSFHAAKNLTTGEGGAVLWNIPGGNAAEIRRALGQMMLHGQDKSAWEREHGPVDYDILFCGHKANLTDLQAAVGLSQLARYDDMLAKRRGIVDVYRQSLPPEWSALEHPAGSACHLFIALMPEELAHQRDDLLEELRALGIGCNVHYKPLPLLTAYRRMGWRAEDYPHAVALWRRALSLPLSSVMSEEQAMEVAARLG